MAKLNQIIAVEKGAKSRAQREIAEIGQRLQKTALLSGISRTYQPLDELALAAILEHHVADLQRHVNTRLGNRSFEIDVSQAARRFLLERGTSAEYGARELKRTIHRHLTQPLAALVARGDVEPGAQVAIDWHEGQESLAITPGEGRRDADPSLYAALTGRTDVAARVWKPA